MKLLNLGCGNRYNLEWTNIDFVPTGKEVIVHNLLKGIPFPENTFDVVYHSHVLEHFSKTEGVFFLKECYRVLKPGGIIRVVVPDLEQIVREYLLNLEKAYSGDEMAAYNYNWIMLEMYDQTVREKTRGEMGEYWNHDRIENEEYVFSRMGSEFRDYRESLVKVKNINYMGQKVSLFEKINYYFRNSTYKNKIRRMVLGKEDSFYEVGKFRASGEIHKWMYDKYSLSKVLKEVGFLTIKVMDAYESIINNWNKFELDADSKGIRKPDSLFMEATK